MRNYLSFVCILLFFQCNSRQSSSIKEEIPEDLGTTISISNDDFYIDGEITLKGVVSEHINMEGLLPNARMVQGIFDDLNVETVDQWIYPDTKKWDPDRNTDEFVASMKSWNEHGLLAFTINLQGGSPYGYSKAQPWENNAFDSDGSLRLEYFERLERILDRADELQMVVILGVFYFGQDERLKDDQAVERALINSVDWILEHNYQNVMIEVANECNNSKYDRDIIKQENVHKLINVVKSRSKDGKRLLVSTSFNGNTIPPSNVVEVSDFVLLHGNGVKKPERITEMIETVRNMPEYTGQPIVFNEDDHFDFEMPMNNMVAAFQSHASWGYFDYRMEGESFEAGYQSVPVDWGINSERKKAFFETIRKMTGSTED